MTAAWHFLPVGKGAFGAGANGFYLQQTTGDSGSGARLGSLKEMTAGVGPVSRIWRSSARSESPPR